MHTYRHTKWPSHRAWISSALKHMHCWRVCYGSTFTHKMVAPSLTFLAISSLSWASDTCSLSLSWSSNLCSSSSWVTTLQCGKKMVWWSLVLHPVFVFATQLASTFPSFPPPSSPVISVWDTVYEYETVGTLHWQTHADTQDTAKHQTRQRYKRREISLLVSKEL